MTIVAFDHFFLVLGGARSGKSGYAERLLLSRTAGRAPVYIATSEAWDEEMKLRIAQHQRDRDGQGWLTIAAPLRLPEAIAALETDTPVLVDCLTLWLTNLMLAEHDIQKQSQMLIDAIQAHSGPLVCVANEVGLGIVPDNALARRFRDAAGRLNQDLAAIAGGVVFVAAGLPMVLKGAPPQ